MHRGSHRAALAWALVLAPAVAGSRAAAQEAEAALDALGSQLSFDARQYGVTRDLSRQTLDGEVVAIGAGTVIAADHMSVDRVRGVLEARGQVLLMNRNVIFTGDAVLYHAATGDFRIEGATMVVNDQRASEDLMRRVLGFTPQELEFEKARKTQLAAVRQRMGRVREESRRQARLGRPLDEDLVERYARLLEEEELIAQQENPSLAGVGAERRETLKRRRELWDASKKGSLGVDSPMLKTAYFRLEGEVLTRTDGNDFVAERALFTPCYCEGDEAPAWGFRADRVEAQVGGYADLHHPVLEIKGVPVLYLPYLKLPLKDRRQSGFLMPTFAFERRAGSIFSQPVFFDLAEDQDATLTTDVFENRGTRLGLEYRIQQRQHTGWDLRIEGIKDRLWTRDRGVREELSVLYDEGLTAAFNSPAPPGVYPDPVPGESPRDEMRRWLANSNYWDDYLARKRNRRLDVDGVRYARDEIDYYLALPSNTWRGAYAWRGVTFFAPRLSLQSNAEITSDHRYAEELYVPDDFQEAIFGGQDAKAFSTAKAQLHLDGRDVYVGLGTRFGDNYLLDERFEGQQIPMRLKVQTRKYSVLPAGSRVPVYAQVTGENLRITELKAAGDDAAPLSLGDGNWRRLKVDTVSPLVTDAVVQVSHFADAEARFIDHAGLSEPSSAMRSWSTGLELRLPIDGKGELPAWLTPDAPECDTASAEYSAAACQALQEDPQRARRHVHHLMDWRLRFTVRPTVVKRGPYTRAEGGEGDLAYFATDRFVSSTAYASYDNDVPEEERFKEFQRISFATNHAWKLFKRDWRRIAADAPKGGAKAGAAAAGTDVKERARRELLFSLDRPVTSGEDLYDETEKRWLVDRYRLTDTYYDTPLTLRAGIGYDFREAKQRKEQREQGVEFSKLAEPWDDAALDVTVAHAGFSLAAYTRYGIYLHAARETGASLAFPRFFASNISLGYSQAKGLVGGQELVFTRRRESSVNLVTSLIPPVTSYISLRRRLEDDVPLNYTDSVKTAVGFEYKSPSKCWGLQFARQKDYDKDERNASYLLRLSVIFMGQERPFPDMSSGVLREMRGGEIVEEG